MFRVLAVGRFDGVHLGHQHLLSFAKKVSTERGWSFLVYTFPPEFPALLTLPAKVRVLQAFADEVEVADWERIRELSAEEFLKEEVVKRLRGRVLVMGPDHRFGKNRSGDPLLAQKIGKDLGLEVYVLPPFSLGGEIVSSSRIRELVSLGEVEKAREFLGRPPVLFGHPQKGAGLAKTLGFPTINLALDPVLIRPRDGVYLAWAFWPEGGGPGLFYHGKRPTFPDLPPSAELHLLCEPPASLPEALEVHLLRFIRPDMRFSSPEALVEQVKKDINETHRALAQIVPPRPILFEL